MRKNPLRANLKPEKIMSGLNIYEARFYEQLYMTYYHTINKNDKKNIIKLMVLVHSIKIKVYILVEE